MGIPNWKVGIGQWTMRTIVHCILDIIWHWTFFILNIGHLNFFLGIGDRKFDIGHKFTFIIGNWKLGHYLKFKIEHLKYDIGHWKLDIENNKYDWTLKNGYWALSGSEHRILDKHWTIDIISHWTFFDIGHLMLEISLQLFDISLYHWTLENGYWTLDIGQWTMDTGHWTFHLGHWKILIIWLLTSVEILHYCTFDIGF